MFLVHNNSPYFTLLPPPCRTTAYQNSWTNVWNYVPSYWCSRSYSLQQFKSNIYRYLWMKDATRHMHESFLFWIYFSSWSFDSKKYIYYAIYCNYSTVNIIKLIYQGFTSPPKRAHRSVHLQYNKVTYFTTFIQGISSLQMIINNTVPVRDPLVPVITVLSSMHELQGMRGQHGYSIGSFNFFLCTYVKLSISLSISLSFQKIW